MTTLKKLNPTCKLGFGSKSPDISLHAYEGLIQELQNLLERSWEVRIKHIGREYNMHADFLAKRYLNMSPGIHIMAGDTTRAIMRESGIT